MNSKPEYRLISGRRRDDFPVTFLEVTWAGKALSPRPSQALMNHSPDGFEWGYGGSGPAQLALAILLEATNDPEFALTHYQDFKWQFVAPLDVEFDLPIHRVLEWIDERKTL